MGWPIALLLPLVFAVPSLSPMLRMAASNATHQAMAVVDAAYHAAGATAIFEGNPFERRFRDIHTVSQQVQAHYSLFEAIGQYFLDLPLHPKFI